MLKRTSTAFLDTSMSLSLDATKSPGSEPTEVLGDSQFLTDNLIGFIYIWKIHFWMSLNKDGPSWKWNHHRLSQDAGLNQKKKHSLVHALSSSGIWIWMQSNQLHHISTTVPPLQAIHSNCELKYIYPSWSSFCRIFCHSNKKNNNATMLFFSVLCKFSQWGMIFSNPYAILILF